MSERGDVAGDVVARGQVGPAVPLRELEELLEEELVEVGYSGPALTIDHYRNDEKMFAFRSRTGVRVTDPGVEERVWKVLKAYEACFRHLGDMNQEGDGE